MTYTLLPCPFCGHQPDEDNLIDSTHPLDREGTLWTTGCLDNEGGCNASMLAGSRQEAIDKWNTRSAVIADRAARAAITFEKHSAAAPAEPTRSAEPVAWIPSMPVWTWKSEAIVKLTRDAQPEYGIDIPLYASPPRSAEWVAKAMRLFDQAVVDAWNAGEEGRDYIADVRAARVALESWLKGEAC